MGVTIHETPRQQAIEGVKRYIRDRALTAGTPLPSQRDLAALIGVSQPTVRRALTVLEAEGWVGPQRGYTRLVAAAATGRSPTPVLTDCIMVLGPERPAGESPGGILVAISVGLQEEIAARGYHAMLFNPTAEPLPALSRKLAAGPAGIAVPEFWQSVETDRDLTALLAAAAVPVVAYGQSVTGDRFDRVSSDHAVGARMLTEHLLARGRRRICQVLPRDKQDVYWVRGRRDGYLAAMSAHGLAPLPPLLVSDLGSTDDDRDDGMERWSRYLAGHLAELLLVDQPVDGILATNDWEVPRLHLALRHLRRTPGEDVLVAGYDNVWQEAQLHRLDPEPPAATIDKLNRELGREMIRLLLARIDESLGDAPVRRCIAPRLISREDLLAAP